MFVCTDCFSQKWPQFLFCHTETFSHHTHFSKTSRCQLRCWFSLNLVILPGMSSLSTTTECTCFLQCISPDGLIVATSIALSAEEYTEHQKPPSHPCGLRHLLDLTKHQFSLLLNEPYIYTSAWNENIKLDETRKYYPICMYYLYM